MKHITEAQSTQFAPLQEDLSSNGIENAEYFTITPSTHERYPASSGWSDVKYFTSRVRMSNPSKSKGDQWVYILSNPAMPNILKIGSTKLKPETRASQISKSTGVPLPFKVEWAIQCVDGMSLENEVRKALRSSRVNNQREFFQISLEEAKNTIQELEKKQ